MKMNRRDFLKLAGSATVGALLFPIVKNIEPTPKYIFFEDPGHGWLQVPVSEIQSLGIEHEISGFSYSDEKYFYLEEDCDVEVFENAREKHHNPIDKKDVAYQWVEQFPHQKEIVRLGVW